MNKLKVNTQKILSAILGLALAAVILFQAGNIQSKESTSNLVSVEEAAILENIEEMLMNEEVVFEEVFEEEDILAGIVLEELESEVKVFNSNNELIAEGSIENNKELRILVNKADLLSSIGGTKYFRIAE